MGDFGGLTILISTIFVFLLVVGLVGMTFVFTRVIQPVRSFPARVVEKRQGFSGGGLSNVLVPTYYYITFEREDGGRVETSVSSTDYETLQTGDQGTLRLQGAAFRGFGRKN